MTEPQFELIEHTADMGVVAWGHDLKEAMANLAYGMSSIMVEPDGIREAECRDIEVSASDSGALAVAWLGELLYLFDTEQLVFSRFDVTELAGGRLRARVWGERFDPVRHQLRTAVKAATYHMLEVEEGNGARVQVILDV